MLTGAHAMIFSKDADLDRAFLRDVLGLKCIDDGGGWLIFSLPPTELGVHPSDENNVHELYFMCEDIDEFTRALGDKGTSCGPVTEHDWGRSTEVPLPGGGKLGVYQPFHGRP